MIVPIHVDAVAPSYGFSATGRRFQLCKKDLAVLGHDTAAGTEHKVRKTNGREKRAQ